MPARTDARPRPPARARDRAARRSSGPAPSTPRCAGRSRDRRAPQGRAPPGRPGRPSLRRAEAAGPDRAPGMRRPAQDARPGVEPLDRAVAQRARRPHAGSARGRPPSRSGGRSRHKPGDRPTRDRIPRPPPPAPPVPPSHQQPVSPSTTFSSRPPAPRAITGRPAACASTAAMPNSSRAVTTSARQEAISSAASASETRPTNVTVGPGEALEPTPGGAVARDHERQPQPVEGLDGDVDLLVRDELGKRSGSRGPAGPGGSDRCRPAGRRCASRGRSSS